MVSYPADWEVEKIKNLVKVISPSVKIQTKDYLIVGHYPIIDQGQNFISGYTNEISVFPPNEYVIFGEHTCIVKYVDFAFAQGADGIKVLTANINRIIPKYLYYCMSIIKMDASYSRHWLRMREQEIPLPPLNEQIAIADTLAAFDTHITNLTDLISKKKAIREGALEDLMSGRTRLKGFSGDWEVKTLGEIANIQDGTHGTFARVQLGKLLLSAKNVFNNYLMITDNESMVSQSDYNKIISNSYPRIGDILMSCVGTIGRCCLLERDDVAFQRSVAFIRPHTFYNKYLMFLLQSQHVQKQLTSLTNASAQGGIYLNALKQITLLITTDKKEQIAIADTLTALDSEIQALESERDKISQIRDGAMNDLLTGKVRLIHGK